MRFSAITFTMQLAAFLISSAHANGGFTASCTVTRFENGHEVWADCEKEDLTLNTVAYIDLLHCIGNVNGALKVCARLFPTFPVCCILYLTNIFRLASAKVSFYFFYFISGRVFQIWALLTWDVVPVEIISQHVIRENATWLIIHNLFWGVTIVLPPTVHFILQLMTSVCF